MKRAATRFSRSSISMIHISHSSRRLFSSASLSRVESVCGTLNTISIAKFQSRAFVPEIPLHISPPREEALNTLPAINKWFVHESSHHRKLEEPTIFDKSTRFRNEIAPQQDYDNLYPIPNRDYLIQYQYTILPYEYFSPPLTHEPSEEIDTTTSVFHTINAPLQLFLGQFQNPASVRHGSLYIAQAQLIDLPLPLQADLPVPRLVKEAGKGDIYDANLWMGIPPTYTPLHKDPNPNLFVQLASKKHVRLYKPSVGEKIFWEVKRRIGRNEGSASMRGVEMFMGRERTELEAMVWGEKCELEGLECVVGPGEALFIPKGWWHSFKSIGKGTTASVNWWFR